MHKVEWPPMQREAANYRLETREDAVAASIARVSAKIAECFANVPKVKAKLKDADDAQG